ncbi:g8427 [Coccomyxa elongata]
MPSHLLTQHACKELDAVDPLAPFRSQFELPEHIIYLDGNSLGALPKATAPRISQVVQQEWGRDLISSWNKHGWWQAQQRVGRKISRIIGAADDEVLVADSTSINLFKVVAAALDLHPGKIIVSERANFPTDLYMLEGLIRHLGRGHQLRLVDSSEELRTAIDGDVAVVVLTHVSYRTGRMLHMAAITAHAQARGAMVVWDLAHSAGAMPLQLSSAGVDFAVGCGYKFLNGGPGAPAFLYVAKRLQDRVQQPLSGWFGHARPFAFEPSFDAAPGIQRFQCGTPPIISLAALEVGVDLMLGVPLAHVREKSVALGCLFMRLVDLECFEWGFQLASPGDPAERGSQICFTHPEGYSIIQALIRLGVVGDFRAPDILRFGFAPLYVRHVDVWDAVQKLKLVMQERLWDRAEYRRSAVVT